MFHILFVLVLVRCILIEMDLDWGNSVRGRSGVILRFRACRLTGFSGGAFNEMENTPGADLECGKSRVLCFAHYV